MKQIKIYRPLLLMLPLVVVFVACKKDYDARFAQYNTSLDNTAKVQVYNAVIGSNRSYLFVDDKPVNGATIAYGSSFPSGAAGFAVQAGQRVFLFKDTSVNATLQTFLTVGQNINAKGNYTFFAYDTVNAAKLKFVDTDIVIPEDTAARIRLASFIFSKTAIPNLDIYSTRKGANIYTNVARETITEFMPYPSSLTDTLIVRTTGSTTNNLINRTTAGRIPVQLVINPIRKRSYTIVVRGSFYTDTSSQTNLRTITSFTNN